MASDRENYKRVGVALKIARLDANLPQSAVAERCQLSRTQLSNIEAGRRRIMLDRFVSICQVVGHDPGEVIRNAWK